MIWLYLCSIKCCKIDHSSNTLCTLSQFWIEDQCFGELEGLEAEVVSKMLIFCPELTQLVAKRVISHPSEFSAPELINACNIDYNYCVIIWTNGLYIELDKGMWHNIGTYELKLTELHIGCISIIKLELWNKKRNMRTCFPVYLRYHQECDHRHNEMNTEFSLERWKTEILSSGVDFALRSPFRSCSDT